MRKIIYIVAAITLVAALGLAGAGCGIGVEAKTGTIEVRVTDAPPGYEVTSINITFYEVAVHRAGAEGEEGEWITLTITDGGSFDLLQLGAADLEELLATDEVTAGKYTQLRLIIGAIEVTVSGVGDPPEVTLPSSELKFVRPFDVAEGGITTIVLDFDATESLVFTGADKIIFKPVVKLSIEPEE